MIDRLVVAVERALGNLVQEVEKGASVLVQYAAGDWHELKAALEHAKSTQAPEATIASSDASPSGVTPSPALAASVGASDSIAVSNPVSNSVEKAP